ncbi:MAG: hypothetical protein ACPLZB_05750 [Caldisericaceae bacterium]
MRYANNLIYLIRSFFRANKVEVDLHSYRQPTRGGRRRPEYVPSWKNGEALRMAEVAGSLRNRLIIEFLIFTGLRNSTLRALTYNPSYEDLWLKQFTIKNELRRGENCVVIICHEKMKDLIPNACKNRLFYYTFIPPKVTSDLSAYLEERELKYGPIQDNEPIFITENRRIPLSQRRMTPISARELQMIVKQAARRAGLEHWKHVYPHCLRKTYESFLRDQSDEVRLDVKDREFLFGHILPGSQDPYFDKTKIEEMRAKYAKMNFEPATIETEERVVDSDELQSFLEEGWRFVANLPNGKVVVSRKVKKYLEDQNVTKNLEKNQPQTMHPTIIHDQFIQENASEKVKSPENLACKVDALKNEEKRLHTTDRSSLLHFLRAPLQPKMASNGNNGAKSIKNDIAGAVEALIKRQSKQTSILSYIN